MKPLVLTSSYFLKRTLLVFFSFYACCFTLKADNTIANDTLPTYDISGIVKYGNGDPVGDLGIILTQHECGQKNEKITSTDSLGHFIFRDKVSGLAYSISTDFSDLEKGHLNGVLTNDPFIIIRHLLKDKTFDDPLKEIAADVNLDKVINVEDVFAIRKLIFGIHNDFNNHPHSWRFLTKAPVINGQDAFNSYNAAFFINSLNQDLELEHRLVKLGDVDFSNFKF